MNDKTHLSWLFRRRRMFSRGGSIWNRIFWSFWPGFLRKWQNVVLAITLVMTVCFAVVLGLALSGNVIDYFGSVSSGTRDQLVLPPFRIPAVQNETFKADATSDESRQPDASQGTPAMSWNNEQALRQAVSVLLRNNDRAAAEELIAAARARGSQLVLSDLIPAATGDMKTGKTRKRDLKKGRTSE